MNIQEIKKKKVEVEKQIQQLLDDFVKESGVEIMVTVQSHVKFTNSGVSVKIQIQNPFTPETYTNVR